MKTVLFATDLSQQAVSALQYAYMLCNGLRANLTVLHVFSLPPVTVATIRSPEKIEKMLHAEKREVVLGYCMKHLKDASEHDNFEIMVHEHTSISDGILETTRDFKPDLLMVGMKDKHTQRGLFTGNIAMALLKKVGCALLMIPNAMRFQKIKTVVYATDFEEADMFAIKKLVALAKPFKAKIMVVHIPAGEEFTEKKELKWSNEMLRQKVDYPNIQFQTFLADSINHGLRAFAELHNTDMLVMMEREHDGPFFKKLFHKDLIKQTKSHISIPLLSFNKSYL